MIAPLEWWKLPFLSRFDEMPALLVSLYGMLEKFVSGRHKDKHKGTILGKLEDAEGEKLSHDEVLGNVLLLFIAGVDTTSITLSWAFYFLAQHQDIQQQVAQEVITKTPTGIITVDQLEQLHLVQALWAETLRFHPTVPLLGLAAAESIELLGQTVPAGTKILMLTRAVADKCLEEMDLGDDLNAFKPSRWIGPSGGFIPEGRALKNNFFGGGVRACPGRRLAEMEGLLFLAEFLRRFQVSGATPGIGEFYTGFVQAPTQGIKLYFTARSS